MTFLVLGESCVDDNAQTVKTVVDLEAIKRTIHSIAV
jgi:hypothetical protein